MLWHELQNYLLPQIVDGRWVTDWRAVKALEIPYIRFGTKQRTAATCVDRDHRHRV
jgi:hypothetical protein